MQGVAGFVIGAVIASAVGVGLQRRKLETLQASHKTELTTLRQTLEQDYERQLKTATDSWKVEQQRQSSASAPVTQEALRQKFAQEQEQAIQEVRSHYEAKLTTLTAQHQAELAALRHPAPAAAPGSIGGPTARIDPARALTHPDPAYRRHAAQAFHNLILTQPIRAAAEPWLADLACLSQDSDPSVRQAAIAAIAQVKSDRVIPWIEQALRDPNPNVVQTAATAINAFKTYTPQTPLPLPKNAAYTPEA